MNYPIDPASGRPYTTDAYGNSRWLTPEEEAHWRAQQPPAPQQFAPPAPQQFMAPAQAKKPKTHKVRNVILAIVGVLVLITIVNAVTNGNKDAATTASDPSASSPTVKSPSTTTATAPSTAAAPAKTTAATKAAVPAQTKSAVTKSQANALKAARQYLEFAAFSKAGLIEQLSASAGSGYPKADAVWAVNQLTDVDWKEQAVRAGQQYLDLTAFSRKALIQQLSSSAGSKFTVAEATYAADKLGL